MQLLPVSERRDATLLDALTRIQSETNLTVMDAQLRVLTAYLKFNRLDLQKSLFSKALIERIFESCIRTE